VGQKVIPRPSADYSVGKKGKKGNRNPVREEDKSSKKPAQHNDYREKARPQKANLSDFCAFRDPKVDIIPLSVAFSPAKQGHLRSFAFLVDD
jgi:hypothetical protein